jgi:DNA-directed RNA polymerase specialized sigma24 family protein
VIAVRMRDLGAALRRLDPESRALLDLAFRRGLSDDEIAEALHAKVDEVSRRREELFERLAQELGVEGREARDELFATLPDLPPEVWEGR